MGDIESKDQLHEEPSGKEEEVWDIEDASIWMKISSVRQKIKENIESISGNFSVSHLCANSLMFYP